MINILIELVTSFLILFYGYAVACCYLNNVKLKNINKSIVNPKSKQRKIFFASSMLVCIAIPIILYFMYPSNTLITNIRLVSLIAFLLSIAAVDFKVQKIPNNLILSAIIFRIVILAVEAFLYKGDIIYIIKDCLLGAIVIGGFFFLLLLLFKNSLGMGDVKLFFVMGLYQGLWGTVNSVFFSLIASFCLSIILLITKKKNKKDTISFGPSILVGTIIGISLSGM